MEIEADVLDHVVRAGANDGGGTGEEGGGHDGVFGNCVATLYEDDFFIYIVSGKDFGFIKSRIANGINF